MNVTIEKDDGRAVLYLSGRFDVMSNVEFRDATKPLLSENDWDTLAIDFTDVPFVDSSGLGSLLLLREQMQTAGKGLVLTRCGEELRHVLDVAQFAKIFCIE